MEQKLHYRMSVRLWKEDKVFGPGICELLQMIDETGSMHQAAARMGLAYSKAWKMMKTTEEGLGFALTERVSGGRQGGKNIWPLRRKPARRWTLCLRSTFRDCGFFVYEICIWKRNRLTG